jgi:hypothetical protein
MQYPVFSGILPLPPLSNVTAIDISNKPDILRIAEEVKMTKKPRLLKRNGESVAMLMPVGTAVKHKPTGLWARYDPQRVRAALEQSAGALAGVDRTQLKTEIAAQRSQQSAGRSF